MLDWVSRVLGHLFHFLGVDGQVGDSLRYMPAIKPSTLQTQDSSGKGHLSIQSPSLSWVNSTTAFSDVELCLLTEVDLHHGKSEEVPNKMLAKPLVSRCGLAKQFFKLFPEGPDIGFGMYVGWI